MITNFKKHVMVLSTGRTGTKYLYDFLRYQGLLCYHEELHGNIETSKYHEASNLISNNWHKNIVGNDDICLNVVNDYIKNLSNIIDGKNLFQSFYSGSPRHSTKKKLLFFKKYLKYPYALSNKIVIDCNNANSALFNEIFEACKSIGIKNYFIILFRNPIKTIHSIYKVESLSDFSDRPSEFKENQKGFIAAACIWKNYHNMFFDKLNDSSDKKYLLLDIENLNKDHSAILPLFNFLDVEINENIWKKRYEQIYLKRKFRPDKGRGKIKSFVDGSPADIINSDLYLDKSFYFTKEEVNQILPIIHDTAKKMKIDLKKSSEEYFDFHINHKNKIGFK